MLKRTQVTLDTGSYQVMHLNGNPAIAWHYTPIHLWKTPVNVLLALKKHFAIPLAALMQIDNPQITAQKMVVIVNQIENEEEKRLLWASTIALMSECSHSAFECERLLRGV